MIYILVALVLFGILTAVLARRSAQTDSEGLTDEMAQFESAQILAYAQSAQKAVDQMIMGGTTPDDIDFTQPNQASFDLGSNIYKIYHPEGGGLTYKAADSKLFDDTADPEEGWYLGMGSNVAWTPTGNPDIVLAAYGLKQPVCAAINEKITGDATIPAFDTDTVAISLIDDEYHGGTNDPFTTADCSDCENMAILCASNPAATIFTFYTIIEAQ